jgi:hypothetical protein
MVGQLRRLPAGSGRARPLFDAGDCLFGGGSGVPPPPRVGTRGRSKSLETLLKDYRGSKRGLTEKALFGGSRVAVEWRPDRVKSAESGAAGGRYSSGMIRDATICYRAVLARDARYDGQFFTYVRTTGIYCRSIFPSRTDPPSRRSSPASRAGLISARRAEHWRPFHAYAVLHQWAAEPRKPLAEEGIEYASVA